MGHVHHPVTAWELEAARRREVVEADVGAARSAIQSDHSLGIASGGVTERLVARITLSSRRQPSTSGNRDGKAPCHPAAALRPEG